MTRFRQLIASLLLLLGMCGCDVWQPSVVTEDELDRGLVVLYPGALNTRTEMAGFYYGLRAAGVDQAIEVLPWAPPLLNFAIPRSFLEHQRPWAQAEAQRLAKYKADHPDGRVTLLGFSGGAMICALVAEEMPDGALIDSIIMMSPGISTTYDLNPMLENTRDGAIVYWSSKDTVINVTTHWLGTLDGVFGPSAAAFGFDTVNPKLEQVHWGPNFAVFGNQGEHTDYSFSVDWIREFVAPWVMRFDSIFSDPAGTIDLNGTHDGE